MSHFGRLLLAGIAALSLLACLAVLALWARGPWHRDYLSLMTGDVDRTYYSFTSSRGRLTFERTHVPQSAAAFERAAGMQRRARFEWGSPPPDPPPAEPEKAFAYHGRTLHSPPNPFNGMTVYEVVAPHWFVALLTLVLPVAWLAAHRRCRRRQLELGFCPTCGYDLRATPDRCPECGTTPSRARFPRA